MKSHFFDTLFSIVKFYLNCFLVMPHEKGHMPINRQLATTNGFSGRSVLVWTAMLTMVAVHIVRSKNLKNLLNIAESYDIIPN
jgi:hypothetical protein